MDGIRSVSVEDSQEEVRDEMESKIRDMSAMLKTHSGDRSRSKLILLERVSNANR